MVPPKSEFEKLPEKPVVPFGVCEFICNLTHHQSRLRIPHGAFSRHPWVHHITKNAHLVSLPPHPATKIITARNPPQPAAKTHHDMLKIRLSVVTQRHIKRLPNKLYKMVQPIGI